MATLDRLSQLQAELETLKQQRKEEKRRAKIESQWVNASKRMPESEAVRVLAWANDEMELAWAKDGKFYAYDGTFFLLEKDRIDGVSHWMKRDWMYEKSYPLYGPGIKNRLRYYWIRFTQRASDVAHDLRPKGWGQKAQMDTKIVYYHNARTGETRMGAPEQFQAPKGFEKITCANVFEAEKWSDRLRQYNLGKESRKDEERAQIEGEAAKEIRSNIHHLMANSHSKYGKAFMQRYLERMDKAESRRKMTREEYLHSEGHERGH
jgi:hypothetical protein